MIEVTEGETQNLRDAQRAKAIELAKLHTIFTLDERGRQLFKLWKQLADQRVPVNATVDQYARAEAIRSFVRTIEDQIAISATVA